MSVDLTGARFLELFIDDGGDVSTGDYADWAGALIHLKAGATGEAGELDVPVRAGAADRVRRSGAAAHQRAAHHRRHARTAVPVPYPGHGRRAADVQRAEAARRPDARRSAPGSSAARSRAAGRIDVPIEVTNARVQRRAMLTIVGGEDALALTPPLGWNSWNVWGGSVDDAKVRAAADAMVSSGLAAHGYQFINIDDGWEGKRDANGVLQPNEKFPDMKALADYVHSKGLKIGIYSSPGPRTCQGLPGSYQHEEIDARTWAGWGFDLLKHDWCSYETHRQGQQPRRAAEALHRHARRAAQGRTATSSTACVSTAWATSGSGERRSAATTGARAATSRTCGRTCRSVGFRQAGREKWSRPGHWTDPDMLVVGKVGWGPNIHDTRLTPNEQITHISLWALQAAPLLIGADMSQFDSVHDRADDEPRSARDEPGRARQGRHAGLSAGAPRAVGPAAGRWHDRGRPVQPRTAAGEDDGDLEGARPRRPAAGQGSVAAEGPRHGQWRVHGRGARAWQQPRQDRSTAACSDASRRCQEPEQPGMRNAPIRVE